MKTSMPKADWKCSICQYVYTRTTECPKCPQCSLSIDDNEILANAVPEIKSHILALAGNIVTGARRGAYGKPEDNFHRIALLWAAWLEARGIAMYDAEGKPYAITSRDVSPMMRLMKEARLCETPDHLDSHVDLVGYTLTGAEVNGVKP